MYKQNIMNMGKLSIEEILLNLNKDQINSLSQYADAIKQKICEIEILIEQCSNAVCPNCAEVCCINRHGIDGYHDIIYKLVSGIVPITYDSIIDYDSPCQYLSITGCILKRQNRPFRCTWFFCMETLKYFESRDKRKLRHMTKTITEIGELRLKMEKTIEKI
jgi:hypothetical protein